MSDRARRITFAVVCVAAVAAIGIVVLLGSGRGDDEPLPATATAIERGDIVVVGLDRGGPATYGQMTVVPGGNPRATRRPTALKCQRVAFASGMGICLAQRRAFPTRAYAARFFDARQRVLGSVNVDGNPSRARVSPGGRYAAATTFVGGDSYAAAGAFSTRTVIFDARRRRKLADLEEFKITKNGRRIAAPDFNFWGVTFDGDSGRFYATLATGSHHYLVKGDVTTRRATVLRDGVECPSLSPDGRRIAFKARVGDPFQWRFHILDLASGKLTELPEERSVDDQIEWLDDRRLAYDRDEIVMQVAADGRSAPAEFLPRANSPATVR